MKAAGWVLDNGMEEEARGAGGTWNWPGRLAGTGWILAGRRVQYGGS